jgi:hypothetical protein
MVCRSYLDVRELKTLPKDICLPTPPLTCPPKDEDHTELQIQLDVLFRQPYLMRKTFHDRLVVAMKRSWTKRRHQHTCCSWSPKLFRSCHQSSAQDQSQTRIDSSRRHPWTFPKRTLCYKKLMVPGKSSPSLQKSLEATTTY